MDEKLWGEKEDVECKEEAMPGDVVSKEVRFVFTKRKAADYIYQLNQTRAKSLIEEFWYWKRISISISTSHA